MPVSNEKAQGVVASAAERATYVTAMIAQGYKGTDLAAVIAPGRTRKEIADRIIELQRRAPKGA